MLEIFEHLLEIFLLFFLFFIFFLLGRKILRLLKLNFTSLKEETVFSLGLGLGIFGYLIYFIGLAHLLYSFVFYLIFFLLLLFFRKDAFDFLKELKNKFKLPSFNLFLENKFFALLGILLFFFFSFNLIAALAPDLGFDALWYHLTEAKIYVASHKIFYIPGSLLYYSAMPRLVEMFFTLGLLIYNDILAKLFHFAFGILIFIAVYCFSNRFFNKKISFLAAGLFYTIREIGFLSSTAYIDLGTTFFGLLFTYSFFIWFFQKDSSRKWLYLSAVFLGLALATKHWAVIFLPVSILGILIKEKKNLLPLISFLIISILIASPWYFDAYFHTKNPFYPLFSFAAPEHLQYAKNLSDWFFNLHPKLFPKIFWETFTKNISPFLMVIPIAFLFWRSIDRKIKYFILFGFIFFIGWSYIPTLVSRYLLPGIPVLMISSAYVFQKLFQKRVLNYLFKLIIIFVLIFNLQILFRTNQDFFKVVLGTQTRHDFLSKKVAGDIWVFYDCDGYFKKNIKPTDKVLVYNVHNLFYIDFPYKEISFSEIDFSQIKTIKELHEELSKKNFTHLLLKRTTIFDFLNSTKIKERDKIFESFKEIYDNPYSEVKLYKIYNQ